MCIAIPGKVTKVEDGVATVDFSGNKVNALSGLVDVKPDDYVLVHAGCIIQVMKERDAKDLMELMEEVNHGSY